jgi:hypothetical protein
MASGSRPAKGESLAEALHDVYITEAMYTH